MDARLQFLTDSNNQLLEKISKLEQSLKLQATYYNILEKDKQELEKKLLMYERDARLKKAIAVLKGYIDAWEEQGEILKYDEQVISDMEFILDVLEKEVTNE